MSYDSSINIDTGAAATSNSHTRMLVCCRWKQKTLSMSWTFKLTDETSNTEIADLKAHLGLRGSSTIHLQEGHWDPAWVQVVVMTAVLAIKSGQLARYSTYGQ